VGVPEETAEEHELAIIETLTQDRIDHRAHRTHLATPQGCALRYEPGRQARCSAAKSHAEPQSEHAGHERFARQSDDLCKARTSSPSKGGNQDHRQVATSSTKNKGALAVERPSKGPQSLIAE
jgi:hypothetical protein